VLEYSSITRRRTLDILRTFYRVRAAIMLLLFQITFFAVVSMFLFYKTPEGDAHFGSMGQSMVTLFVLLSTCNSPRVMFPAFNDNKLSALYFVFFLVVSVFLMLNLVLAVVYHEHRRHLKNEARRLTLRKRVCTSASYRALYLFYRERIGEENSDRLGLLSRERYDEGIPVDLVFDLLMCLGVQHEKAALEFVKLLSSGGQFVARDNFEDILLIVYVIEKGLDTNYLKLQSRHQSSGGNGHHHAAQGAASGGASATALEAAEFGTDSQEEGGRDSEDQESSDQGWDSDDIQVISPGGDDTLAFNPRKEGVHWYCGKTVATDASGFKRLSIMIVAHHVWLGRHWGYVNTLDLVLNSILIVSGIITVTLISLAPEQILMDDPLPYTVFNAFCSVFFFFEITVRIWALSPSVFFASAWNMFEFIIVFVSFFGLAAQITSDFSSQYHHLFLFLRKLRLLRLLRSVPHFRLLMEILVYLVPTLFTFGGVIFVFMYMYAILGIGLLGDVRLPEDEYFANDFRSFPLALLTLFELIIVNDWNATMASFYKATGDANTQIFFIVWYLFAIIILLNSVTSFALEALDLHISHSSLFKEPLAGGPDTHASRPRLNPPVPNNLSSSQGARVPPGEQKELHRSMSFAVRVKTAQQVGRVANQRANIVNLLQEVFNEEIDEPSVIEIDEELRRNGLHVYSVWM